MTLFLIPMPGNESLADSLSHALPADCGQLDTRHFPDGESYIRFVSDIQSRSIALVCTLFKPNEKVLELLFSAATARELGATTVGLIAPYLAYMRQDQRFQAGEAITSREVAKLLSSAFDWLVTVDPHLHRYSSLADIYTIPTRVVHAAPVISNWIRENVRDPLLVGPDCESEQWVSAVAKDADAPFTVLEKVRRGDRDVQILIKNMQAIAGRTPVLVDDIISSGKTMLEAVRMMKAIGAAVPICLAVHGLFADQSDKLLVDAGARVVTCNTVPHATNTIHVENELAAAVREVVANS